LAEEKRGSENEKSKNSVCEESDLEDEVEDTEMKKTIT